MTEARAPRGNEWADVVEVLHFVANTITVRSHYTEGHKAIAQADELAANAFTKLLDKVSELVVALIDGEFVICERPLPDLRARLHVLADAMKRHDIECLVFQHGMTRDEITFLGRTLALGADVPGKVRDYAQQSLTHVLLRFAELKERDASKYGLNDSGDLVPYVQEMLVDLARCLATETPVERLTILAAANQILLNCKRRTFTLVPRCYTRSFYDEASHATNVATMTAAMALEAGYPEKTVIDAVAGALVHDIGHVLLPEAIRGMPEPLLDEQARPVFRNHTFAGAQALMLAGCHPLWVAAALEHHRGVDGQGYPKLESAEPPHELVRMIALANYFDRRRSLLEGAIDQPDMTLQRALGLEEKYFGKPLVKRFLHALGVYPPGTTVELSNRQPALVTQVGGDPWRPQVRLLRGVRSGRRLELREMNPVDGRHELSIVRAILPPLLVLEDAPLPEAADEEEEAPKSIDRPLVRPPVAAGPSSNEVARSQLAHMDNLLDALEGLSVDALRGGVGAGSIPPPPTGMPPAPSAPPPALRMPQPTRLPPMPTSSVAPPPPPAIPPPPRVPPPREEPLAGPKPARRPLTAVPPPPPREEAHVGPKPARRSVAVPPPPKAGLAKSAVPRLAVKATDLERVAADPRGMFIIGLVDGMSTVEDIAAASGQPEAEIVKLLEDWLARGVITVD